MIETTKLRHWDVVRCSYGQLLREFDSWIADKRPHVVCFCEGNGLSRAWRKDAELRAVYAGADAVCADGIALDWMARMAGGRPGRITGPKLFPAALECGVPKGWRHFLYGTNTETLNKLKQTLMARFPGVRIVGTFAPGFGDDPQIPPIEKGSVDFLWVSLGCPKQEKWCARHKDELGVSVILPVGAAFDFLSGKAARPPEWVNRIGMCWLWRLVTGGRRVFVRNVKCVSMTLWILVREFVRTRFIDNQSRSDGCPIKSSAGGCGGCETHNTRR